ncbi:hypothetical protein C8R45DRAFT_764179, partial [Mycena sanguinolenta]
WVHNYRDSFLRVLLTREGPMGQGNVCSCGQPSKYRCVECFGGQILCRSCMIERHRLRPLCHIEIRCGHPCLNWVFPTDRDLGLRVQLGHRDNTPYTRVRRGHDKFVVIAPNGFHYVAVDFCECRQSGSQLHWEQLLSYGWYPSTP